MHIVLAALGLIVSILFLLSAGSINRCNVR